MQSDSQRVVVCSALLSQCDARASAPTQCSGGCSGQPGQGEINAGLVRRIFAKLLSALFRILVYVR
eukprot:3253584-Alexandrium_andersonii.AAC.1